MELGTAIARLAPVPTSRTSRQRPIPMGMVIALVACLGATGCAASPTELAGREFISVAVTDGGVPRPLAANTTITLNFTDSTLDGNAGCNHFGFDYRIEDGRLIVSNGAMTAMGCPDDLNEQEQWVFQLLGSKPAISLLGTDLTVQGDSIVVTLRDRKVVEPDAPIVGPTWHVDAIITGDAVSTVPAGTAATLVFREDGTIEVDAGCNRGSGTWTPVAGGIEVGPLVLTEMACQREPAELESAVLAVLEAGSIAAVIDGRQLTLQAAARGLVLRAG